MADHDNSENSHGAGHGAGGGGGGGHGHGAGHEEHHEGAPEWLISFADNVALMMGFFVILLAMNMQKPSLGGIGGEDKNIEDSPEMQDFVIAVRKAFNSPVDLTSTDPGEAALRERIRQRMQEEGESRDQGPDGDKHDVQAPITSNFVAPIGVVAFEPNGAAISRDGEATIAQLAAMLRGRRIIFEVRGHTSAVEAFRDPRRGMELAHRRALAVAERLVEQGMKWPQLRVTACADAMPLNPRADAPAEHGANQRVEVVATQETAPPDPFTGDLR
jgi:flagellar motor protein MotB